MFFFHGRTYYLFGVYYNSQQRMSIPKAKVTSNCDNHPYCPHLHYKKCRKERERNIPYSWRPNKQIDTSCNVHPKTLNKLKSTNIPTLAFEKYNQHPILPDQEQTNFSKHYYLQNLPETFQLNNTLLNDVEAQLATNNAYTLASGATQEYNRFAKQREEHLSNARRRAGVAFDQFYLNKRKLREQKKAQQARWVTQYFRKVQDLIDHIFHKKNMQNEDPNLQDKIFLKQQSGNTASTLSTAKIRDSQAALNILQSLRAVLLKKKMDLEQDRKDQEYNKSATASYMDSSNTSTQNVSAVSFLSGTSQGTKQDGQADFAEQLCDFQKLAKKWGKSNVDEVRQILKVMLCRNLLNKAEGSEMRERQKARKKDEFLRKEMEKMSKLKGKKGSKEASRGDKLKQMSKTLPISKQGDDRPVVFFKDTLNSQEQKVKTSLVKGGIYDTVGTKYERNRNYSSLFQKRRDQTMCQLSFRDSPPKYIQTARTNL